MIDQPAPDATPFAQDGAWEAWENYLGTKQKLVPNTMRNCFDAGWGAAYKAIFPMPPFRATDGADRVLSEIAAVRIVNADMEWPADPDVGPIDSIVTEAYRRLSSVSVHQGTTDETRHNLVCVAALLVESIEMLDGETRHA